MIRGSNWVGVVSDFAMLYLGDGAIYHYNNCMYIVLSSVCLCLSVCFYILSVFTALWRINVFNRKSWAFDCN